MQNAEPRDGLVLLCDLNGVIQQVVTDELDITRGQSIGRSFVNLVSSDNLKQAFGFVEALQSGEPALGWGLYCSVDGERTLIHLNGYALEGEIIITGARSRVVATQLYHKMLRSHHAQLNSLHATLLSERTAHTAREKELQDQVADLQDNKSTLQEMLSGNVAAVTGDLTAATDIARQITDLTLSNKRLQSELTAAREAKAALSSADSAFTTVFRAAPIAMCISARSDGRLVGVNDQFERMLGYRQGELVGQSFYRLLAQGTRATIGKIEAQLAVPHSPIELPTRLRNHEGEILDVVAGFELMELNGEACVVTAVHLNSERVQTAQDMADQEQVRRELSGQVAGLQREVDMLREELRTRRSVDAAATQQVNTLRDQIKKLEAEISARDEREQELRQQVASYQPSNREHSLRAQITSLQSTEQTLNTEIASLRAKLGQLESELEEHKLRVQEQTGQVTAAQRLNFRIEALHNAVQAELRAQIESLQQDKQNLDQEVAKLRQTEEELSHLTAVLLEEAGSHEQTSTGFQQREQELLAAISALQAQATDLQAAIEKRDQLLAEQAPLLAERADALDREIAARHMSENPWAGQLNTLQTPIDGGATMFAADGQIEPGLRSDEGEALASSELSPLLNQITRLEGYVRESEVLTDTLVELTAKASERPQTDNTTETPIDAAPGSGEAVSSMRLRQIENTLTTMTVTEDELRNELASYHQKEQRYLSQIAALSADIDLLSLELQEMGVASADGFRERQDSANTHSDDEAEAPHVEVAAPAAATGIAQDELLHEIVVLNTKEQNYRQQVAELTTELERLQQALASETQAKEIAATAAAAAQQSAEAATIAARMSSEAAALASIPMSVPESTTLAVGQGAAAPGVPSLAGERRNPFAELALTSTNLNAMLRQSADALQKQMGVEGTCILLMDAAQQNLIPAASSGIFGDVFPIIPFERSELSTSEPVLISGRAIGGDTDYTTLALPLSTATATVGVALASYGPAHLLQADEVDRADEMAKELASAIAHVLAHVESQRRLDDLAIVYRAALRLHPLKNSDEVAQEAKAVLEETFRHDFAEIMLADVLSGELRPFMIAQRGRPYEPYPLAPAAPNKFVAAARREAAANVVKSGESTRRDQIRSGPQAGMAFMCVPVWIGGRAGGALYLETREEAAFSAVEQQRLEMLALPLGTSIRNSQAILALEEQLEQLRALNMQLAGGEDTARRKMAQQLQVTVGQNLTMLSIYLDNLHNEVPGDVAPLVAIQSKSSQRLVDDISKNVRDVIAELHPPALDEVGLAGALRWYGGRFSERTGVPAIINSNQWVRRLSPTLEAVLFRIAQETLASVESFDPVKPIRITLNDTGTMARLSITGGGVALAPDKTASGLARSRERAAAVGGELRIENTPGEEPQVVVEVGSDALTMA